MKSYLEIERPKIASNPSILEPTQKKSQAEALLEYYNLLHHGTILDLTNHAKQSAEEQVRMVINLEIKHNEGLLDSALEADRKAFLDECQKSKKRIFNAIKFLHKALGTMSGTRLRRDGFCGFNERLGQASLDLLLAHAKRLIKEGRRGQLGAAMDDEFRSLEQDRIAKEYAEKELAKLRAENDKLLELASSHYDHSSFKTFSAGDVARRTGLGSAKAAIFHLEKLAAKGEKKGGIAPKSDLLGNWELSLKDYATAVSYINGRRLKKSGK